MRVQPTTTVVPAQPVDVASKSGSDGADFAALLDGVRRGDDRSRLLDVRDVPRRMPVPDRPTDDEPPVESRPARPSQRHDPALDRRVGTPSPRRPAHPVHPGHPTHPLHPETSSPAHRADSGQVTAAPHGDQPVPADGAPADDGSAPEPIDPTAATSTAGAVTAGAPVGGPSRTVAEPGLVAAGEATSGTAGTGSAVTAVEATTPAGTGAAPTAAGAAPAATAAGPSTTAPATTDASPQPDLTPPAVTPTVTLASESVEAAASGISPSIEGAAEAAASAAVLGRDLTSLDRGEPTGAAANGTPGAFPSTDATPAPATADVETPDVPAAVGTAATSPASGSASAATGGPASGAASLPATGAGSADTAGAPATGVTSAAGVMSAPPSSPSPVGASAATSAAHTAAAGPATPQSVAAQLLPHLTALRHGRNGTHHVTLVLDPAELGPVRAVLNVQDGVVSLHLSSQQDATRDLLRDGLNGLLQDLGDAGVDVADADVLDAWAGSGSPDGTPRSPDPRPDRPSAAEDLPRPPRPDLANRHHAGSVDITV